VNHAFAKRYGAESAVGKTIRGAIEGAGPAQIIGVVEDVKPVGLDKVIHPEVFVDYRQSASEPGIALRGIILENPKIIPGQIGVLCRFASLALVHNVQNGLWVLFGNPKENFGWSFGLPATLFPVA
jgi:hypothetical protein